MVKCKHCKKKIVPVPVPTETAGKMALKGGLGAGVAATGIFTAKGAAMAAILGGPVTIAGAAVVGATAAWMKSGKSPVAVMCPKCSKKI